METGAEWNHHDTSACLDVAFVERYTEYSECERQIENNRQKKRKGPIKAQRTLTNHLEKCASAR